MVVPEPGVQKMAKSLEISTGVVTVAGTVTEYTIPASAHGMQLKCDKASAASLRWQVKDGSKVKSDITTSTGKRLAAGEGWDIPAIAGTLQVIGDAGGTASYELTVTKG